MEFINLKVQRLSIKDKMDSVIQCILNHEEYYGDGSVISL